MPHRRSSLRVEVIRTTEAFDAMASDWCSLERKVPGVLPFQTYRWNRCWWDVFSVEKVPREDELYITAFYKDTELVAVLPLFISRFGVGKRRVCRYLRPLGADPNLTEIRSPLTLPDHEAAVLGHWLDLVSDLKYASTQFQVVAPLTTFDPLAAATPLAYMLDRRVVSDFILELKADWPQMRSGLKRNIKESIRHCYNSVARDQLVPALRVLDRAEDISQALPLFYQWHGTRAHAQSSVAHPDYFADPKHRAFLEKLVLDPESGQDATSAVQLKLFCLTLNTEVVAMRLGFVSDRSLYLYYSGYDLKYSKYSVMTTLVTEMVKWSIERGLSSVNLSIGSDVSKTRWGPTEVPYGDYHFAKNSFLARQLGRVILALKSSRRSLNPFQQANKGQTEAGRKDARQPTSMKALTDQATLKLWLVASVFGEYMETLPM